MSAISGNYFNFSKETIKEIERGGTIVQILTPAVPLAYSIWNKDYYGFGCIAAALIANQICIESLKRLIPETRPNGHSLSFPSGHTMATAFGAAALVKRNGIENIPLIVVIAACVAVIGVGFSRVVAGKHWTHDVIAGGGLGSGVAWWLIPTLGSK